MQKEKLTQIIPELYKKYGDYVNRSKMIPYIADGLLPVQRRLLLSTYQIARNNHVKTAEILGHCMSHYHPFAAAEGPIANLVQNGLIDGSGQWGARWGSDPDLAIPAAPRYTKAKTNKFIESVAFEYINDVPWLEIESKKEPLFLPTMIPLCLFAKYENVTMAFGYKPYIPVYNFTDLSARLSYLIGKRKRKPIIYPRIEGCDILSNKKEIEDLLTIGKSRIHVNGKCKENKSEYSISVFGWPPNVSFEKILDRIDKYSGWNILANNDVVYSDLSNSKEGTHILFEINRSRNRDDFYEKMKQAVMGSLSGYISYEIITQKLNDEIGLTSVDEFLVECYKLWKQSVGKSLNASLQKIKNNIKENDIINAFARELTKNTIPQNLLKNEELFIKTYSKKLSVDESDFKDVFSKYPMSKFYKSKIDSTNLESKKKEIESNIKDIENYCYGKLKSVS